jgi:hypothetical protein
MLSLREEVEMIEIMKEEMEHMRNALNEASKREHDLLNGMTSNNNVTSNFTKNLLLAKD